MGVAELEQLAHDRGLGLDDLEAALRALPRTRPAGDLTDGEIRLLERLGVDVDARTRAPSIGGLLLRQQLERSSLTTKEAAELLGRAPSRIRQRLEGSQRSLLGFHRRSGHREWL
jgi:hypothetical protein